MTVRIALAANHQQGVTIVEVLVAALLIFLGLGSIFAMNAQSIHSLRSTRQAAASSLVIQQRIETFRDKPWPEISNSTALVGLMQSPTESEPELSDAGLSEFITISAPADPAANAGDGSRPFSVVRQRGAVRVSEAGDLGTEPMLLVEVVVTWRNAQGAHERRMRTILCRTGLTRSGIFGNALGRPAPPVSSTSDSKVD